MLKLRKYTATIFQIFICKKYTILNPAAQDDVTVNQSGLGWLGEIFVFSSFDSEVRLTSQETLLVAGRLDLSSE